MYLIDSTLTPPKNWTVSYVITGHLVAELRSQEEFSTADQTAFIREDREEVRK